MAVFSARSQGMSDCPHDHFQLLPVLQRLVARGQEIQRVEILQLHLDVQSGHGRATEMPIRQLSGLAELRLGVGPPIGPSPQVGSGAPGCGPSAGAPRPAAAARTDASACCTRAPRRLRYCPCSDSTAAAGSSPRPRSVVRHWLSRKHKTARASRWIALIPRQRHLKSCWASSVCRIRSSELLVAATSSKMDRAGAFVGTGGNCR